MKTIHLCGTATLFALALLIASSCSEHYDDAKYASLPPSFSDMTFTNLDDTTIKAGDKIVATAVQSSIGRLLNGTNYTWTATPDEGVTHKYKSFVIYDNETANPTDTIVFPTAGTYTVTLTSKYKSSGNNQAVDGTSTFTDGKVTYTTGGLLYYSVVVEKTVVVK